MKDFDKSYTTTITRQDEHGQPRSEQIEVSREDRAARDRSFTIGGETFTRKPAAAPEAILNWNKATVGEVTLDEQAWLALYDETILALLEEGQKDLWLKVRDQHATNPLTVQDLTAVIEWLFTEMTGRPTGQPSGSSPGPDGTEASSTAESSSLAVPV